MTGFGTGEAPIGGGKLSLDIRGVNHRFLDLRVRLPRELAELTSYVEQLAREKLARGRFEIGVRVDGIALGAASLDKERAVAAYRALTELRDAVAPGAEVPLSLLASIPDLFVSTAERESESLREALRRAFERGVQSLDQMRTQEGAAMAADLTRRLHAVRQLSTKVVERAPEVVDGHRKRLKERAERLRVAIGIDVDPARLEQEIVLFAERSDVSEEVTRLTSHCDQFEKLTGGSDAVGRKLDFLLQEMTREVNTLGAKSADALVSHVVVEIKAELERMREQVQNVE